MSTKYQFLFVVISFSVIIACEKVDVPDPTEVPMSGPVFYSDLDLGGLPFSAQAGVDNYLMDATFKRDPLTGTVDLIGYLRPEDCNARSCVNSLKIILRDKKRANASFNIDQMINTSEIEFASTFSRDSALVKFIPSENSVTDATVFTWQINDEKEVHNRRSLESTLNRYDDYQVKLNLNHGSCKSLQIQTVNLSNGGCKTFIRVSDRKAAAVCNGKAPFKYKWSNGMLDSIVTLDAFAANNNVLSVQVIDSEGCMSEASLGFSPGASDERFCRTDFTYDSRLLELVDRGQIVRIFVEVSDQSGVIYRSNGFVQPQQAVFKILEVSDFERNERGQKTKKIVAEINCLLSQQDAPEKEIKLAGRISFAVAYPE